MTPPTSLLHRLILAGMILPGIPTTALRAETGRPVPADTFVLGMIHLGGEGEGQGGTTSTVTGDEARKENRATLEDALGTLPGVSSVSAGGGSRNEREVFVRGFDRWHVPLSIDGIRIFLPADNRLDYGRFLTPDLSEIQVQKSHVSVLNGPGGMGGAINLVTRTPTKPFEGEARLGLEAGNRGDISGRSGYLSLGTRRETWYAQASLMRRETDGFWLSRDFTPVPQEDGGLRDNADTSDSRVNVKLGYTPNATDEYVLSYTRQTGAKNAPYNILLPISGVPGTGTSGFQRDWTWPEWDISSLAFYTDTELDTGYVKTRLYYNTFDNTLSAWDNSDHASQTTPRRTFDSVYDDYSLGASVEYGVPLGAHDLKAALHFRRDVHRATNYPTPSLGVAPDPTEYSKEETISLAVEDSWRISDGLRVVGGFAFNRAKVLEADRTATDPGLPRVKSDALDGQLAAIWNTATGGEVHASVSSRTSFPTLFHRYSTRFDTFVPNPDLKAERATNIELGYRGDLGPVSVEGAVFHSRVSDLIQAVYLYTDSAGDEVSQQRNVGKGVYKGIELAARWDVTDRLGLKANYTHIHASIADPSISGLRIADIPRHKAWLGLDWKATETLTLSPSLEIYGPRWSDPAVGSGDPANPIYTRMGGFGLANLAASWQVTPAAAMDFGIRNLFDRDIQVVEGFPEAGRTFYLTSQLRF